MLGCREISTEHGGLGPAQLRLTILLFQGHDGRRIDGKQQGDGGPGNGVEVLAGLENLGLDQRGVDDFGERVYVLQEGLPQHEGLHWRRVVVPEVDDISHG